MTMKRAIALWVVLALLVLGIGASGQDDSGRIGPTRYPLTINPLTGLPVGDPELLDRRPLLIKISNSPAIVRQEQYGINEADLVWETLLSGGVTRFSAIFYAADAERVGPVRSGRLVDFELTRIYRSLFAYSGMAQGVLDILRGDRLVLGRVVGGAGPCPPLCRYPKEGVALEHTLYGDTAGLRALAAERNQDITPEAVYGMAFTQAPPAAGIPLEGVTIRYRQAEIVWDWDDDAGAWLRSQDGEPHSDALGVRIRADNVLIFEDYHTIQPAVGDNYWGPGDFAFSVNMIGSGRVFLLRDGQYWRGEWQRSNRTEPLTFFGLDGNPLPFAPGKTFVNLVPLWIDGYELNLRASDAPEVQVNGTTGVSIRLGPSAGYATPDVAYPGDRFRALGRNWNGTWVQVVRDDERPVWLPVDRVTGEGFDVMALPNPRPLNERGG